MNGRHPVRRLLPIFSVSPLMALLLSTSLVWAGEPQPGQDYHAIQIASSPSLQVLERQFARFASAGLPYLRIERRGALHVLRAGFWASAEEARAAAAARANRLGAASLVRVAAYRPEAVVRSNWNGNAVAGPLPQTVDAAPMPPMSAMPVQGLQPVAATPPDPAPIPAPAPSPTPLQHPDRSEARVTAQGAAADDAGLRPFDPEDYALAYDAFLGGGDLESAFRLARKAVASVPEDTGWRRKLARVAEWTQRPALAWTHWAHLFRRGDQTKETLAAVWRLAPLMGNPELALEVWEQRVRHDTVDVARMSEAQWADLFDLYEAGGKPRQGSLYFEEQYRRHGKLDLLEYAARLAENLGDDERALQLYLERARLGVFSQDATLRAAITLMRREQLAEARTLMLARRDEVAADAKDYWHTLANLAFDLSDADSAEFALGRLDKSARSDTERPEAGWRRLVYLLRQQHPERAADLALTLYQRNADREQLLTALSLYAERGRYATLRRIFATLTPEARTVLEADPRFLLLRARYFQWGADHGDKAHRARAWSDLQRARMLKPDDDDVVVSSFWFLIDNHRFDELRPLLKRYAGRAEAMAAYWLPYAAAHHALDRYREAMHWYRKEIERTPDDMLLLLNYADALDRVQQAGMAERVRRHAWLRLREKFPRPEWAVPLDDKPQLLALARLALLDAPGDPALKLVRQVVGELRGLSPAANPEADSNLGVREGYMVPALSSAQQTRDLILGWAISREQHPNARAWLWLNAARSTAGRTPLWGEAQTALQLNETQRMDHLLRTQRDGLPIYNRYDTAYALEHWPLALDIAYHGMATNDVDEELHDRYRQHAPRHASHVQVGASRTNYGALDSRVREIELHLALDRRLQVSLAWSQQAQSSDDALVAVTSHDRLAHLEARWLDNRGDTRVALFRRNEQTKDSGWRLARDWAWHSHLNLSGMLERRAEATESLPLRIGGSQDSLRLGLSYAPGKREYIAATQRLSRYHTQDGDYLGRGHTFDLEAGYRLRIEYPDWQLRAFASRQHFSHDGALGASSLARLAPAVQAQIAGGFDALRYFLPEGSTTVGACMSMGENLAGQNLQDVYTRAWRYFYDVCPTHNNRNGAGYAGVIGMAGSLSGEDHFLLRLEQTKGGTGAGALSRVLAARYRHYF